MAMPLRCAAPLWHRLPSAAHVCVCVCVCVRRRSVPALLAHLFTRWDFSAAPSRAPGARRHHRRREIAPLAPAAPNPPPRAARHCATRHCATTQAAKTEWTVDNEFEFHGKYGADSVWKFNFGLYGVDIGVRPSHSPRHCRPSRQFAWMRRALTGCYALDTSAISGLAHTLRYTSPPPRPTACAAVQPGHARHRAGHVPRAAARMPRAVD